MYTLTAYETHESQSMAASVQQQQEEEEDGQWLPAWIFQSKPWVVQFDGAGATQTFLDRFNGGRRPCN